MGPQKTGPARLLLAALLASSMVFQVNTALGDETSPAEPCGLSVKFKSTATRVTPAGTIILDDGSEVVLSGILLPQDRDAGDGRAPWPPAVAAFAYLAQRVGGKSITIATSGGGERDRYGRHVAHVFVNTPGGRAWVQGALLTAGQARADILPSRTSCLAELLAHEHSARTQKIGLWRHGPYRVRSAEKPASLVAARGTFQIIEGKIAKVSAMARMTYLNFGETWRDDFSIGIPAAVIKEHPEWAKTLHGMTGRAVRVRGWIERRNGPFITLVHPAQLEISDDGKAAALPP